MKTYYPLKLDVQVNPENYANLWYQNLVRFFFSLGIYLPVLLAKHRSALATQVYLKGASFELTDSPDRRIARRLAFVFCTCFCLYSFYVFETIGFLFILMLFPCFTICRAVDAMQTLNYLSYRGIDFRFSPSVSQSFLVNFALPALSLFTAGLTIPLWRYRRMLYKAENLQFGHERFSVNLSLSSFLKQAGWYYLGLVTILIFGVSITVQYSLLLAPLFIATFIYTTGLCKAVEYRLLAANSKLGQHEFKLTLNVQDYALGTLVKFLLGLLTLGLIQPGFNLKLSTMLAQSLTIYVAGGFEAYLEQQTKWMADELVQNSPWQSQYGNNYSFI